MSHRWIELARAEHKLMRDWRRSIHQHPEIGLHLPVTQQLIIDEITRLGLTPILGEDLSSVTVVLDGHRPGPTVLLRADMDALPLTEESSLPYASRIEGAMHACGHDLHVSMLLGALRILSRIRDEFCGHIIFMFQPGEEGHGGAEMMLKEGVLNLTGRLPKAAYAVHVMASPWMTGELVVGSGPILAAADRVDIQIHGRGGHAASPHLATDLISAISSLALQLQIAVTKSHDPTISQVFNIGSIHSGNAPNVIPTSGDLSGTLRSFDEKARESALQVIYQVCAGVETLYGVEVEVEVTPKYPLTSNTPSLAGNVRRTLDRTFDQGTTSLNNPIFGAEDFGYILREVPGAMVFIGAGVSGNKSWNHAADVLFDDDVLTDGAATFVALAMSHLSTSEQRAEASQ